jgi:hypothetical protein
MNLILRPLEDVNDVTWSIIICMVILLFGTAYYIYTIMSLAYKELEENGQVREQGQEGSIKAESRQRDCEES